MLDDKILVISVSGMGEQFAHLPLDGIDVKMFSSETQAFLSYFEVVIFIKESKAKIVKNNFSERNPTINLDNLGGYLRNELYRL